MIRADDRSPVPPLHPGIVALALVGWLGFVGFWVFNTKTWFEQQTWPEVTASVVDVDYRRGAYDRSSPSCATGGDRGPRVVLTTYRHAIGGRSFIGRAYDHMHDSELFCDEESAQARIATLKAAGSLSVYVDPANPARAVQQRQEGSEAVFVLTLLFVVGVCLVLFWRRQRRLFRAYEKAHRAYLEG